MKLLLLLLLLESIEHEAFKHKTQKSMEIQIIKQQRSSQLKSAAWRKPRVLKIAQIVKCCGRNSCSERSQRRNHSAVSPNPFTHASKYATAKDRNVEMGTTSAGLPDSEPAEDTEEVTANLENASQASVMEISMSGTDPPTAQATEIDVSSPTEIPLSAEQKSETTGRTESTLQLGLDSTPITTTAPNGLSTDATTLKFSSSPSSTQSISTPPDSVSSQTTALSSILTKLPGQESTTILNNANTTTSSTSTQNPTSPGQCTRPSCASYNSQPALPGGIQPTSVSRLLRTCSKDLLIFNSSASVSEAASMCAAHNATVLALESMAKMACILNAASGEREHRTLLKEIIELLSFGKNFWSSGTNEGNGCDREKVYGWCSKLPASSMDPALVVNDAFWLSRTVANSMERCLVLGFDSASGTMKIGVKHADCLSKLPVVCERNQTREDCTGKQQQSCPATVAKNNSLFTNGVLQAPQKFGMLVNACGSTFLFGNKPVTWVDNWKTCGTLGMQPLSFESKSKQECMQNFFTNDWSGNFNYWTGGLRQCEGNWVWCGQNAAPSPMETDLDWDAGQPDNKGGAEFCAHLKILRNSSGIKLSDRNCTSKLIFACQDQNLAPAPSVSAIVPEGCPNVECLRNESLFDKATELIGEQHAYGRWYAGLGKQFLLVETPKLNWASARQYCCMLGMDLLSLDSAKKLTFFKTLATNFTRDFNTNFWTSANDFLVSKNYKWCVQFNKLDERRFVWKSAEPSFKGNCAYVEMRNKAGATLLVTSNCGTPMKFICEKPQPLGFRLQEDCSAKWDISADVIDQIMANKLPSYTLNIKCFLRCMGEGKKLFEDNALLGGAILIEIERLYDQDELLLQSKFNDFSSCSKKSNLDPCITAGDIFKCGMDKDPAVVKNTVRRNALEPGEDAPPPYVAPNYRYCSMYDTVPCKPNSVLINELKTTSKSKKSLHPREISSKKYFLASLGSLKSLGGKVRFVSIKMTYSMTREEIFQYCCSIGMTLLKEDNFNALKSIITKWHAPLNPDAPRLHFADTRTTSEGGVLVERLCDPSDAVVTFLPGSTFTGVSTYDTYFQVKYDLPAMDPYHMRGTSAAIPTVDTFVCDPL